MKRPVFKVGRRKIGHGEPAFIVAELSGNHGGSFKKAEALVRAAARAGADAVKLQTYTPDTITLNSDRKWFRVGGADNPREWQGKTLYELYQELYTPWEWQPKLKKLADELGIILFSTPFDETAVDFLERMHVPCYKIASYEATDFVLLRKVAQTGKPVILSIGYASLTEVEFALKTLRENGAKEIAVLHCVTAYADTPTLAQMNLRTIADIRKRFGVVAGFSDNNAGIEAPMMAAQAGASIIEKHLILSRADGGPDARFSLEPEELAKLVQSVRRGERGNSDRFAQALGKVSYGPVNPIEEYNKRWRRSLFAGTDIKKGELFTAENVRDVRPAFGLETKYFDDIMGKRAARDIAFATPLSWKLVDQAVRGISLRRADLGDTRFLFELRNEPDIRQASFSSGLIPWADHRRWLKDKLASKTCALYITEIENVLAGQIRFDVISAREAKVNVALFSSFRGKGYGRDMIVLGTQKFLKASHSIQRIHAYIKPNNAASVRSFLKAGYVESGRVAVNGFLCVDMVFDT